MSGTSLDGSVSRASMMTNRLGFWSAVALVVIGVAYAAALGAGFVIHGLRQPIADPVLAIMEILTLLSAIPLVTLMAVIYERAAPDLKAYGLVALAFATLCAGTTSVVHFAELTAARQLGGGGIAWPSRVYAAELLAWDVFLGLALLFGAFTFDSGASERVVRRGMMTCALLCLAGTVGPIVGNMRLQFVGLLGYGAVLPVVALLLVRLFARQHAAPRTA
jgi:hypothetical protein